MRRIIVQMAHRTDFRYPLTEMPPWNLNLIKTYTVGLVEVRVDDDKVPEALKDLQEHHYQSVRGTGLEQRMPRIIVAINEELQLSYDI